MNTIYLALFLISAATLAFQVTLTRFFSLAQGHHLAFMAVSLALLGAGASGTYLSLRRSALVRLRRTLTGSAFLFTLSVPAAYLAINTIPFDAYRIAWERAQLLWLMLYYLALTVPFFFSGLVIGAALAAKPEQAGKTYAANLLGAGLGPPLALLSLGIVGGPGTVFLCALLGWLSVIVLNVERRASRTTHYIMPLRYALRIISYILITLVLIFLTFRPPTLFDVRLTPYKSLFQTMLYPGSEIVFQRWNAFSRVDVVRSEGIRSAPGLSFAYAGNLPPQLGLMVDGDNLTPITGPTDPTFTQHLPLALGFELRPNADVLILEPGGGLAVLTALQNGARSVTVVQSNHTVAEAVSHHFADFNQRLYQDTRVTLVIDEPRSYLRRSDQTFDLILLPLTDSFRSVTAGAYTLNEDYRYTVEAFSDALVRLSPGGLLLVERWLQLPPSESLRLWGTALEALRLTADRRPLTAEMSLGHQLLALRSFQTSLVGVANTPFSTDDLATARRFVAERQFDLVWMPGMQLDEVNHFSVVPDAAYYRAFSDLLTHSSGSGQASSDSTAFYADYPYAVAPPTDDHPFFFHFFRWQQTPEILRQLGKTWQPFGGSGYLMLVVLLILVIILSSVLILLPLFSAVSGTQKRGADSRRSAVDMGWWADARYLLYFALLGLGFLFVEIPLLQRFILYLGQPAYAFAVVVSALLLASGVGSGYLSGRLSLRVALPLIALLTLAYPLLLPYLFDVTLQLPFVGRVAVTLVALFPLGILMGVPFPRGLTIVGRKSPGLIPWVWAVNGCASVISAVLAAMVSLTWGFSAVLWGAALAYGLATALLRE